MSESSLRLVCCLTAEHVPACQRLHKYAKYNGEYVFGVQAQKDVSELLRSAAEGRDGAHGWVAVSSEPDGEGEVVGALTAQWEEPDACVLLTLVVRSDARGQGVGKALLQALQQHVRARQEVLRPVGAGGSGGDGAGIKLLTDVSVANDAALGFFKRAGFKQVGRGNGRSVELSITCISRSCSGSSSCSGSGSSSSCRAWGWHARAFAAPVSWGAGQGREPHARRVASGRAQRSCHAHFGSVRGTVATTAAGMVTRGAVSVWVRPSSTAPGAVLARQTRAPVRVGFGCC